MTVNRLDALTQYTNEAGREWIESNPIPKNYLVFDEVQNIVKKGDGVNYFNDLPIWLDLNILEEIYDRIHDLMNSDIFSDEAKNKLLIINRAGRLTYCNIDKDDFENWIYIILHYNDETFLSDFPLYSSNVVPPIINGHNRSFPGGEITLYAKGFSLFGDTDELKYYWTLPDGSVEEGDTLYYTIENDEDLIGSKISFSVYSVSKTGFRSYKNTHEVLVGESFIDVSPTVNVPTISISKVF